jgi:ABC-2 type transport system permease protein
MIVRGELDFYLALPKPVLPHSLISRMNLTAPGDVLFGVLGFALVLRPGPGEWALFGLFLVTTASILIGFGVVTQSLAFWLGSAEGIAQQLANALISFSTYPTGIFHGAVKLALFSVIPAGFIAYAPVRILQEFSWPWLLGLLAFSIGIVVAALVVFRLGSGGTSRGT